MSQMSCLIFALGDKMKPHRTKWTALLDGNVNSTELAPRVGPLGAPEMTMTDGVTPPSFFTALNLFTR
jgi:hypothetical protein